MIEPETAAVDQPRAEARSNLQRSLLLEARIPLEVVILLLAGLTMLLTGILLFPISSGKLSFYQNGLLGLLLVIFSLQIITMGKTPFGDVRRSIPVLAGGVTVAIAGIVTCFIPDLRGLVPRVLLILFLGFGGFLLLLQMTFGRDKARAWIEAGGIFRHLTAACSIVYVMSMVIALFVWKNRLVDTRLIAVVVLLYGLAIFYLAGVLWKVYRDHPEAEGPPPGRFELSESQSLILLTGLFMVLLGVLLIPVNLGILPFSGSAQLGLLVVIFAVQMLALGSTPIGLFARSWLLIAAGLVFAGLGIVSCIVPGILVKPLTYLIGAWNLLNGSITIAKTAFANRTGERGGQRRPAAGKISATLLTTSALSILFGIAMLVSSLIPGLVLGGVLAVNGCVLLYMLYLIVVLDRMTAKEAGVIPVSESGDDPGGWPGPGTRAEGGR